MAKVQETMGRLPVNGGTAMTFRSFLGLAIVFFLLFHPLLVTAESLATTVRRGDRGPEVIRIQEWLGLLGYFTQEPTGYFGEVTHDAVSRFQQDNGLLTDGIVGSATYQVLYRRVGTALNRSHKVSYGESIQSIVARYNVNPTMLREYNRLKPEATITPGQILRIPPATIASRGRSSVKPVPWEEVHRLFKVGSLAKVIDVETGLSFFIYRRGGHKHADCEPYAREDTAIMLEIYNGKWSWERRAVVVEFGSHRIAASMNGMPHGNCDIKDNNFDGHFCLHFLGSRTHKSDRVDRDHQSKLMRAAGMFRSN